MKKFMLLCISLILLSGCSINIPIGGSSDNQDDNNKNNEEVVEKDYDINEAESLVNKYLVSFPVINVFEDGFKEDTKMYLAISNVGKDKNVDISCTSIFPNATYDNSFSAYLVMGNKYCTDNNGNLDIKVKYSDANESYKKLFGSDQSMPKQDFRFDITDYIYNEENDLFALLYLISGSQSDDIEVYAIKSAKTVGDKLIVDYGYSKIQLKDDNGTYYATELDGEMVHYNYDDVISNTEEFEKKFISENLEKMNTYRFTFVKDGDNYILDSLKRA